MARITKINLVKKAILLPLPNLNLLLYYYYSINKTAVIVDIMVDIKLMWPLYDQRLYITSRVTTYLSLSLSLALDPYL